MGLSAAFGRGSGLGVGAGESGVKPPTPAKLSGSVEMNTNSSQSSKMDWKAQVAGGSLPASTVMMSFG
jgi:hypothetical protein